MELTSHHRHHRLYVPPAQKHYTFTIVTIPVAPELSWLHDRMPLILNNQPEIDMWLNTGQYPGQIVMSRLVGCRAQENTINKEENTSATTNSNLVNLDWYPVSMTVNNIKNDSPKCIEKLPFDPRAAANGKQRQQKQQQPKMGSLDKWVTKIKKEEQPTATTNDMHKRKHESQLLASTNAPPARATIITTTTTTPKKIKLENNDEHQQQQQQPSQQRATQVLLDIEDDPDLANFDMSAIEEQYLATHPHQQPSVVRVKEERAATPTQDAPSITTATDSNNPNDDTTTATTTAMQQEERANAGGDISF
eukprot:GEZU01010591.1.p2 GENE.GEZU01010591.1~~GEZU01010591.1.p2  ORF type:complete len:307 (-),score=118.25 GEZU01010591.1:11-931(-)